MKHILDERLIELSLEGCSPSPAETAHLATCAGCAQALRAELELSEALATMPQAEPPVDFVSRTCAAFETAMSSRQRRFTALTMTLALLLGNLAALFFVGLVVMNASSLAHGVALTLNELLIAAQALRAAASALPALLFVCIAIICTAALGFSALLGRLVWVAAPAK